MSRPSQTVVERLAQGPRRGLGCAEELAREALQLPVILGDLVAALRDERKIVTTRAANALKKVAAADPQLLAPHAHALLRSTAECKDLQTRWNLTVVAGEVPVRGKDKALAKELLYEAMGSASDFLRVFALTGLMNLAGEQPASRRRVQPILLAALEDPSAAVRARARKLVKATKR